MTLLNIMNVELELNGKICMLNYLIGKAIEGQQNPRFKSIFVVENATLKAC